MKNYNCDGGYCTDPHGEVRLYPLGCSSNLILCESCFIHENNYRLARNAPTVNWVTASRYPEEEEL